MSSSRTVLCGALAAGALGSIGLGQTARADTMPAPALLSLNKPVSASSVENASFSASSAVDGNPATRWSSEFSDPQWIRVGLG